MPLPDAVRALVVADTHLTGATLDRMPDEVWAMAEAADLVVHAGDVLDPEVLAAFADHAPLHAVLGNNDRALVASLPETLEVELGGVAIAVIHDAGATAGRHRRMARRFPAAEVVVFGHSHTPVAEREGDGPLLVNPGSPVQRRRQPVHTVAWLHLAPGAVTAEVIEVGPLAG
ncbi:YfcE family phosphodiesterase [soil metagenome]